MNLLNDILVPVACSIQHIQIAFQEKRQFHMLAFTAATILRQLLLPARSKGTCLAVQMVRLQCPRRLATNVSCTWREPCRRA
jgi:hypothetical protein